MLEGVSFRTDPKTVTLECYSVSVGLNSLAGSIRRLIGMLVRQ